MSVKEKYPHIVRKAAADAAQGTFSHPWNPKSEITGSQLAKLGGLKRTGVSLARLAPGKESFAYHSHHQEEEWIYVLSGKAIALIDGVEYTLEPGDFVGFPTPSVAHLMANPGPDELVYLMGGENKPYEVADFPMLDKRMVKLEGKLAIYKLSDAKSFDDTGD
jgi:uncharacterized cupin superfamily protein